MADKNKFNKIKYLILSSNFKLGKILKQFVYGWNNIISTFNYWRKAILFKYEPMSKYKGTNKVLTNLNWEAMK